MGYGGIDTQGVRTVGGVLKQAATSTERQLVSIAGDDVLAVLGRSRLRLRSAGAVRKNREFLLVAKQWSIPGGKSQKIGTYKFSRSFDDLGVLTGIKRKKGSWLSRAWDTVKPIGEVIWRSWKDNPFQTIFQVGKIALGALALVLPGTQALGVAALALNLGDAAFHAVQGDTPGAIGAGLPAFTAGADIFGKVGTTAIEALQGVASSIFGENTLSFLDNAKRALDIGTLALRFAQATSLADAIGAGLGAVATGLGSGGQLPGNIGALEPDFARQIVEPGTTVRQSRRRSTSVHRYCRGY